MSLYAFFYLFVWKKIGVLYDRFLHALKLHRKSEEAHEKVATSHRSSSDLSPTQESVTKSIKAPSALEARLRRLFVSSLSPP